MKRFHHLDTRYFDMSALPVGDAGKIKNFKGGFHYVRAGAVIARDKNGVRVDDTAQNTIWVRVPHLAEKWLPLKPGDSFEGIVPAARELDLEIVYDVAAGVTAHIITYDPENAEIQS